MKCAGYVIAGMLLVPAAMAVWTVILMIPMFLAEEVFGVHHAWGGAFWIVTLGAVVGAAVCREGRS